MGYPSTLAIRRSLTIQLVSSLIGLDEVISVHTNNNVLSCLVTSNPVKPEMYNDLSPNSECSLTR